MTPAESSDVTVARPDTGPPSSDAHVKRSMVYVTRASVAPAAESAQITDPFTTLYQDGMAMEPPLDPEMLMLLAEQSVPHGACLEAKADDVVGNGWELTSASSEGTEGDDPEEATEQINDLLEDLTPDLTFDELLWAAAYEEDAVGWSAIEVVRAENGDISALYPMPAHTVRFTKDRDVIVQMIAGTVRYFARFGSGVKVNGRTGAKAGEDQRTGTGRPTDVSAEDAATEVIIFRGYSGRSRHYPVPRWVTAIPTVAELTAIREYNISYFASGGTVDRLIHVTAGDVAAAGVLQEAIDKELTEQAGQAHVTIVTAGDSQSKVEPHFLVPTSTGEKDGSFRDRRSDLFGEVLVAHKVPPYRVAQAIAGVLTGSGPSREMLQAYRVGVVSPRQNKHAARLNATLFGQDGIDLRGYKFAFKQFTWDETDLDRALAETVVTKGLGSPNEGRAVIGLPRSEDPKMDVVYFNGVELAGAAAPGTPETPGDPSASTDGEPEGDGLDELTTPEGETTTPADELGAVAELRLRARELAASRPAASAQV